MIVIYFLTFIHYRVLEFITDYIIYGICDILSIFNIEPLWHFTACEWFTGILFFSTRNYGNVIEGHYNYWTITFKKWLKK